jgi:hypothetical protein
VWSSKPPTHESYSRRITLTNTLTVPLTFTVGTTGPYVIVACTTNAPKHPLSEASAVATLRSTSLAPSRVFTLMPRSNLVVDAAFDPSHADARPLEASLFGSTLTGGVTGAPVVPAPSAAGGGNLKEEYVGGLVCTFANGSVQEIALRCEKLRPVVVAAPPLLAFGVVHVEARGASTLYLANPTAVEAEWELRHVPIPARKAPVSFDAKSLGLVGSQALGLRLDATPRDEDNLVDDPSVFTFNLRAGTLCGTPALVQCFVVLLFQCCVCAWLDRPNDFH